MKKVKINTEFITLGQLLKLLGIISNGSEAKSYMLENKIVINGEKEERRGRKIYSGTTVFIQNDTYFIEG